MSNVSAWATNGYDDLLGAIERVKMNGSERDGCRCYSLPDLI